MGKIKALALGYLTLAQADRLNDASFMAWLNYSEKWEKYLEQAGILACSLRTRTQADYDALIEIAEGMPEPQRTRFLEKAEALRLEMEGVGSRAKSG